MRAVVAPPSKLLRVEIVRGAGRFPLPLWPLPALIRNRCAPCTGKQLLVVDFDATLPIRVAGIGRQRLAADGERLLVSSAASSAPSRNFEVAGADQDVFESRAGVRVRGVGRLTACGISLRSPGRRRGRRRRRRPPRQLAARRRVLRHGERGRNAAIDIAGMLERVRQQCHETFVRGIGAAERARNIDPGVRVCQTRLHVAARHRKVAPLQQRARLDLAEVADRPWTRSYSCPRGRSRRRWRRARQRRRRAKTARARGRAGWSPS